MLGDGRLTAYHVNAKLRLFFSVDQFTFTCIRFCLTFHSHMDLVKPFYESVLPVTDPLSTLNNTVSSAHFLTVSDQVIHLFIFQPMTHPRYELFRCPTNALKVLGECLPFGKFSTFF